MKFFLKSVGKFLRYGRFLWRHYTPLLVENWPNFAGLWKTQFLMKTQMENTKRRKMRSSTRWPSRFFKILGFWPLKFQKIDFFGKWSLKSKIFKIFKKTVTYVIHLLVVYQCTKFQVNSSIFDPKWSVFVSEIIPSYDVIFSNAIFVTSGGRTQKQIDTIRFLSQNWSRIDTFFVHIYKFENLTFFDLTLTWPSLETSKNGLRQPN